jgi:hypothetical protein
MQAEYAIAAFIHDGARSHWGHTLSMHEMLQVLRKNGANVARHSV